jgi:hypothetical protein
MGASEEMEPNADVNFNVFVGSESGVMKGK